MLQNDIQQPVGQGQMQSGIPADDMTASEKEDVTQFASMLQAEASSYLPDIYDTTAGCVRSPQGVIVKLQILHGGRPLIAGDVMIQNVDKTQEGWEEQAKEITTDMLAQSINELLQNDTSSGAKGS